MNATLEGARKELLAALEIDRGLVAEKPSELEWQESRRPRGALAAPFAISSTRHCVED